MITENEPMIKIVRNTNTDEFTITLQNWDTGNEGDTKEEAQELISQLEKGIYYLNTCWEDFHHGNLFEQDIEALLDEEKTKSR